MAISILCPHCKQGNQFDDSKKGQEVRCAHCRKGFVIKVKTTMDSNTALDGPAARADGIQAKTRPVAPARAIQEAPPEPRRGSRIEEVPDDPRPRRRDRDRDRRRDRDDDYERSSSNTGLIVGLIIGGVVLVGGIVGVVCWLVLVGDQPAQIAQPQIVIQAPAFNQKGGNPGNFGDPFAPQQGALLDPTRADHFDLMMKELMSENEDARHRAYDWLKQADPKHPRAAEVTKILESRVAMYRAQVFGDDQFFAAYFAWATKDNFPWLSNMAKNEEFTVWGNQRRHTSMEVMARLKDERGVEVIAGNLESIHHRDAAYRALVSMGPVAEKNLWPLLTSPQDELRAQVARVVGAIGTRASLDALQKAAQVYPQDGRFNEEIATARKAIQARAQ